MPRFNPTRFPPGFFDLAPDAGRDLPLDIIMAWTRSDQTVEAASALLAPRTLRGIVVSSDAAGLTRLTQERSLIEILAMINRPKELVHAYGRAIGGVPLGVWAADNTLMFYPEGVSADTVVGTLLGVVDRVRSECEVGIGLCAHRGSFFELGKGIYGPDADRVESVAEDHTGAGELLVTGEVSHALSEPVMFNLMPRPDLLAAFGELYRVDGGPRLDGLEVSDFRYPLPFTDEFYGGLVEFQRTRRTSLVPRPAYRDAAVLVVETEREDLDVPEVAVLNDLALAAAVMRLGQRLTVELAGLEVKSSTGISIYLFDEPGSGAEFAKRLRDALAAEGVQLRMGMDVGRVLLFELGAGLMDIAGSPVNVASKLAQDVGRFGSIQLTVEAAKRAGISGTGPARTVRASGVTMEAVTI